MNHTIKTLTERILEAYQKMDWRTIQELEQTNQFRVQYPQLVQPRERPVQAEQVYLHEGGVTEIEYK